MKQPIKLLELFGGIGACTQAFKNLGIQVELVDYVEIDKYAVKSFNAINGTSFEPQDIQNWDKNIEVDFIMHGSPCQDFSLAGQQAGADEGSGTRSSLMYETLRIVKKLKPKYVLWENVKNAISKRHKHNFDAYCKAMNDMGYLNYYKILNAKDYGIPQHRERVFCLSIMGGDFYEFPAPVPLELRLRDVLEKTVDDKYYLSNKMKDYLFNITEKNIERGNGNRYKASDLDGCAKTITTKEGCRVKDNFIEEPQLEMVAIANEEKYRKMKDFSRRVYNEDGLAPTIHTCPCGNTEPKVLIKNANKKGYAEAHEGDNINLQQPNSKTRRGRVGDGVAQTLQTSDTMGVLVPVNAETDGTCRTIKAQYQHTGPANLIRKGTFGATGVREGLVIRKLTPRECWRLMGFPDGAFDKAQAVNSNCQLYKQAGNSIVVNVLEEILRNLFIDEVET